MRKRKYAHGVANYYRPDTLTEHIDEFWTKKMKQKLDNVDNVDNLDNSDNLINVDSNLGNLDHLNLDHLHDFFKMLLNELNFNIIIQFKSVFSKRSVRVSGDVVISDFFYIVRIIHYILQSF